MLKKDFKKIDLVKELSLKTGYSQSYSKKIVDDFKINAATQPKMDVKSLDEGKDIKVDYEYKSNVQAPIKKGQVMGSLKIISDGEVVKTADLIALENVEAKGFFGRLWSSFVLWVMMIFMAQLILSWGLTFFVVHFFWFTNSEIVVSRVLNICLLDPIT